VKRRVDFLELLHADASGDVEVVNLLRLRPPADHSFPKIKAAGIQPGQLLPRATHGPTIRSRISSATKACP
jgi:hypothetical protein